ncbi:hypothetical protein [Acidithrix ferrooxidans]|uniref:Phage integrase family protein n=1 Tax=Acidithrix ferrooxidans TaxID=1280514 RepID=A0A0D8HD41_9ACTN|nr:hypothetical protein [Acidithrix ferrooxidans]KJF15860.1 hypothetical protein AXFE_32950 [Acidithrix ferrooxidans]
MVEQLSLEELIVCTRKAIAPLNHSKSTLWQYNYGWEELRFYFIAHGYGSFSIDLAGRYVDEAREKYEKGALKMWKFKLFRHTQAMHLYQAGMPTILTLTTPERNANLSKERSIALAERRE